MSGTGAPLGTPPTSEVAARLARAGPVDPPRAVRAVAALARELDAAARAPGSAIPGCLEVASGGPGDRLLALRPPASGADLAVGRARFGPPPGEVLDERSDVYALGVVLFVLLTGRFPLGGTNPVEWALAHRQEFPPAPSKLAGADRVPGELDAVVLACLAKSPAARPASRALLADRLDGIARTAPHVGAPAARRADAAREADAPPRSGPVLSLGRPAPRRAGGRGPRLATAAGLVTLGVATTGLVARHGLGERPDVRAIAPVAVSVPPVAPAAEAPAEAPAPPPPTTVPPPALANELPPPPGPAAQPPRRRPAAARTPAEPAAQRPAASSTAVPAPAAAGGATEVAPEAPADVSDLLRRARTLAARKRFLAPADDNALALYRAVLDAAPGHAEAGAQVRLIRDTYHELARARQAAGDLDGARELLRALAHGLPGDLEVDAWLAAVEAERRERDRTGTLTVSVRPWGAVFLDGRYVDETALSGPLEVAPGRHTVLVRGRDDQTRVVEVEVRGGETKHVPVDLTTGGAG